MTLLETYRGCLPYQRSEIVSEMLYNCLIRRYPSIADATIDDAIVDWRSEIYTILAIRALDENYLSLLAILWYHNGMMCCKNLNTKKVHKKGARPLNLSLL